MNGIWITVGVLGLWTLATLAILWFNHRANLIRKEQEK